MSVVVIVADTLADARALRDRHNLTTRQCRLVARAWPASRVRNVVAGMHEQPALVDWRRLPVESLPGLAAVRDAFRRGSLVAGRD